MISRTVTTSGIVLMSALAGVSGSAAQEYRQPGQELLMCYNFAAIKYAVQTCEPSATLVDAVFGSCSGLEQKFRRAVDAYAGTKDDPEFSHIVLQQVRDDARPKILSTIVDLRVTAGKTCP